LWRLDPPQSNAVKQKKQQRFDNDEVWFE